MDANFEPNARNEAIRRAEWRKRLVFSHYFHRCIPVEASRGQYQCVYWDTHVTTAGDPDRNLHRKKHRLRYFAWAKAFCDSLDPNVDTALTTLSQAGQCIPCFGRSIYESLILEVEAPYCALLPKLPLLRDTSVILTLEAPNSRQAIEIRDSMRSGASAELIRTIQSVCGRPHLKELVLVLNHGRKQNIAHQHARLGRLDFNRITTDFTVSMLKQRARTGGYNRANEALSKDRPFDQFEGLDHLL